MNPQLKDRILRLSDEELLEMVELKFADYRQEALEYAAAELESRGISFALGARVVPTDAQIYGEPASDGRRYANYFLDTVIILLISVAVASIFGSFAYLASFVVYLMYYFAFESFLQKTPAKYVTNTKVVSPGGVKPEPGAIAARTLIRLVPLEWFFSREGRWWHDRWSNTQVVRDF